MAFLKIKRSEVSGNPSILGAGELAYSGLADNGVNGGDRLYIGMGTETSGNAVNHVVIGGKYFTDIVTAATSAKTASTLVKRDSTGMAFLDVTGNLTGNASTASAWATARTFTFSGDISGTLSGITGGANATATLTLPTVNSTTGNFGSGTAIPVITVNAKGLVTSVSTVDISTVLGISGNTGTDNVTLGTDTLSFVGTGGVTTAVTNNTVTINIDQSGQTPTFGGIIAGSLSVGGDAVITGNLTVQGTTTTINSTILAVSDKNIEVAKNATDAAGADGAGITVTGPAVPATFIYTAADNRWNLNKDLNVANVYGALKGNADTATKLAAARSITATGDASYTISFDGSANATAALTLATVNSTVGTFGTSVDVPVVTVNAKGLVTNISTTTITAASSSNLGLAKFDATNFSVANDGLVSIATVDGGTY